MDKYPHLRTISEDKAFKFAKNKSLGKQSRPRPNFGGVHGDKSGASSFRKSNRATSHDQTRTDAAFDLRSDAIDLFKGNGQSIPVSIYVRHNLNKLSMFYAFWLAVVSYGAAYLFAVAGYSTLAGALITHGTFSGAEFLRMFKRRSSR